MILSAAAFLTLSLAIPAPPLWRSSGLLALDAPKGILYVADGDRAEIAVFQADRGTALPPIPLPEAPAQLLVGPSGALYATLRRTGAVIRIDADGQTRVELPGEPYAMAASDDGGHLYVTLAQGGAVVALSAEALRIEGRTPVLPEPRPLVLTSSGRLLVGHLKAGALSVLEAATLAREADLSLAPPEASPEPQGRAFRRPGRARKQTWALVLEGTGPKERVLVAHRGVADGSMTPTLGGYGGDELRQLLQISQVAWTERGAGVLDLASEDVAISGPTVAALGPNRRLVLGAPGGEGLYRSPGFNENIELLYGLAGGALGLLGDPARSVVYALSLERKVFRMDASGIRRLATLAPTPLSAVVLRGRRAFFQGDLDVSRDGVACASCHPEGQEDGTTWALTGLRRNTPALAGRLADTSPYNWNGTETELSHNIRQTIERLGGGGLPRPTVAALAQYLLSLPGPTQPSSALDPEGERGRGIFARDDVGCADCHVPEAGFTDGQPHDLGLLSDRERDDRWRFHQASQFLGKRGMANGPGIPIQKIIPLGPTASITKPNPFADELATAEGQRVLAPARALDTPSLRGLARSAPYLHDGSAPDLETLLAATDGKMGHTAHLEPSERSALLAYLRSL